MENLFSTNLTVNNHNVNYRVIFENEKYVFIPEAENKEFSRFSFKRQHDQWVGQEPLPTEIKDQAIDALEKYLLKQL